jgi:antitoxin component of MazEF toxin-antitoxin module
LGEQTEVDLRVVRGKIVMALAEERPIRLSDLLSGVTKRNLHDEVGTGASVGREAW